ncbi:MAG TPA: hypothetical protein VMC79_12800 [Rectinemataceae bacterium]|nr:hypothetical protein [Rectinemataceae bacterium]
MTTRGGRSWALALALSLLAGGVIHALEAKEGLVRLVVNESTARVSLYRLVDIAKDRYVPLLFDQDPRTSFVTLSIDGRQVKLGDASDYRVSVARTDTGVKIEFRSALCVVREILDFAHSDGSALADGLRVSFELENVSERDSQLGIRYLLDTYLAEKSGVHFVTDQRARVNAETAITPTSSDTWVQTPGEQASFMVQLSGPGVDRPDLVLLANWKRLSDSPWSFEANGQRNFTLVPYSINDSAIGLFWQPSLVQRGAIRKLSFVMGSFNEKGYPLPTAATATDQIFAATVLGSPPPDKATAMAADLVSVRDLISQIDRLLASGSQITDDELATWKKILDRLEERKKDY